MNDIIQDGLVPIFAIFCVFGLPIMAWTFFRVLAHRERMAMIRHGFAPGTPARPMPSSKKSYDTEPSHVTLAKGIRLACIGLAVTIGLSFIGYHGDGVWYPGPWLLGGLVPLFIGIAQILIALVSGASFGPNFSGRGGQLPYSASFGQSSVPPPASPDATTFDGPYTYRPGSTEQLRPPSSPPERR